MDDFGSFEFMNGQINANIFKNFIILNYYFFISMG